MQVKQRRCCHCLHAHIIPGHCHVDLDLYYCRPLAFLKTHFLSYLHACALTAGWQSTQTLHRQHSYVGAGKNLRCSAGLSLLQRCLTPETTGLN